MPFTFVVSHARPQVPPRARTRRPFSPAAAALLLIAACDKAAAPTCLVTEARTLPAGALGDIANVRLEGLAAGLLMSGWDDVRGELRAAPISESGTLGPEIALAITEPRIAGPWYAAVAKVAPADQLIAVYGIADPARPDAVALRLLTATAGTPATPPVPFVDPEGRPVFLQMPPAPGATVAMATSASGKVALFAAAAPAPAAAPLVFLVGADGATQSLPAPLPSPLGATTCLALTPSRLSFAVSRVIPSATPTARPRWLFVELTDQGVVGDSFDFDVLSADASCPLVGATPVGYVAAWQNRVGTHFADIGSAPAGVSLNAGLVKGAVRFGGADKQPALACVASAGQDVHLTFASTPPAVERFTRFGIPAGGALPLPAANQGGPIAAWPRNGATFVTFLQETKGETKGDTKGDAAVHRVRQFLRVECPSAGSDAAVASASTRAPAPTLGQIKGLE